MTGERSPRPTETASSGLDSPGGFPPAAADTAGQTADSVQTEELNGHYGLSLAELESQKERVLGAIDGLVTPFIDHVNVEGERAGIGGTQLLGRRLTEMWAGLLTLRGAINLPKLLEIKPENVSRDVFFSYARTGQGVTGDQVRDMALAAEATGLEVGFDEKPVAPPLKELPESDGGGFVLHDGWEEELEAKIKEGGHGVLVLTKEALESPVVLWEVSVMLKKDCHIVVAFDGQADSDDGKTILDHVRETLGAYKAGTASLVVPDKILKRYSKEDYVEFLETIAATEEINEMPLEASDFENPAQLANKLVRALTKVDMELPDQSVSPVPESRPDETGSLNMDEAWGKIADRLDELEKTIQAGSESGKLGALSRVTQARILFMGILKPELLMLKDGNGEDYIAKKRLFIPKELLVDEAEPDEFMEKLWEEFEKRGFEITTEKPESADDRKRTLSLVTMTEQASKDIPKEKARGLWKLLDEGGRVMLVSMGRGIYQRMSDVMPVGAGMSRLNEAHLRLELSARGATECKDDIEGLEFSAEDKSGSGDEYIKELVSLLMMVFALRRQAVVEAERAHDTRKE